MTQQTTQIRMTTVDPATADEQTKALYAVIKSKMGKVPNTLKTVAHSPAVLEGYLGLAGALGKAKLSAALREQVSLAVSQENGCEYCLSAHSVTAKLAGLKPEQIIGARKEESSDPKAQAVLTLTHNIMANRGNISDSQLSAAREAGLSDAEIVEVVGVIAVMTITNLLNNLAHTEIDFPRVPLEV